MMIRVNVVLVEREMVSRVVKELGPTWSLKVNGLMFVVDANSLEPVIEDDVELRSDLTSREFENKRDVACVLN